MKYLLIIWLLFSQACSVSAQILTTDAGQLSFISNAPLEIIRASSNKLQGALDLSHKKFAFKLFIKTFDGFNNSLQKVHFFENYMETNQYPEATFTGKIIDQIDLTQVKKYRAKGIFDIHGVKNELIIYVLLEKQNVGIAFSCKFELALSDHEIQLPRIVYQKIAEVIKVNVSGLLTEDI